MYGLHRVFFEENAGVRKVFLNRPKKLNIINYEKVCQMLKKLEALVLVMLRICQQMKEYFCATSGAVCSNGCLFLGCLFLEQFVLLPSAGYLGCFL